MQTSSVSSSRPSLSSAPRSPLSFAALSALASDELEVLFASGHMSSIAELGERPRGRALAFRGLDSGLRFALMQKVQASPWFVWEGKSFHAGASTVGTGINRVRLPQRMDAFTYRTALTASRVDGKPCVAIDYDQPENPWFMRGIYDEVRRVADGLYLGRGMLRVGERPPVLLLWFALDARTQDTAL